MTTPKYMLRRLGYAPNHKRYLVHRLDVGTTLIGRSGEISMECDYKLNIISSYCSRNHCYIIVDPEQENLQLRDISTNGTYINGRLLQNETATLKLHDVIMIGYTQADGIPVDEYHYSFKVEYFCDIPVKVEPDEVQCVTSDIHDVSSTNILTPMAPESGDEIIIGIQNHNQTEQNMQELMINLKISVNGVQKVDETSIDELKNVLYENVKQALENVGKKDQQNTEKKSRSIRNCRKQSTTKGAPTQKVDKHKKQVSKVQTLFQSLTKYSECPLCFRMLTTVGLERHLLNQKCKKIKAMKRAKV